MGAAFETLKSPETYFGTARRARLVPPGKLELNQWSLEGRWTESRQYSELTTPGGKISFRFHARDVHLVMGATGRPVRFRVEVDGVPPGRDAGSDIAADGTGTVTGQRLYQLVRQKGAIRDRTFTITFLDPGVQAFAFTFG
jgi:hypothetical protein